MVILGGDSDSPHVRLSRLLETRIATRGVTLGRVAFVRPAWRIGAIFQLFLTDKDQFAYLQLWKSVLLAECREKLWKIEWWRVQI